MEVELRHYIYIYIYSHHRYAQQQHAGTMISHKYRASGHFVPFPVCLIGADSVFLFYTLYAKYIYI